MTFTHTHAWTLDANPGRVFHAISDSTELTVWFAEDVAIEPHVGGAYRFWGRHTLGTPAPDAARQTVMRYEPDAALGFSWPINEVETDVTMVLVPHGKGTRLTITHQVSGDLGVPRQRELIDDHWRLVIGNLAAHLAGGEGVALPDYFLQRPEVRIVLPIDVPPAAVFRALVEPERINRWFGTSAAEVEPRVGGRYCLHWSYLMSGKAVAGGPTQVLDIVPDERLVLDWPDWRGDPGVSGQTITFLLAPDGRGGTTLTFVHAGFARTTDMGDYGPGWREFLRALRRAVSRGFDPGMIQQ